MIIKKTNMAERVAKAAAATPGIEERLRHAQEVAHAHPAAETTFAENRTTSSPTQSIEESVSSRLQSISIHLIDTNPFNARKIYRPERVNELAASIGAHGQDVPGIATIREGRYVLAAGHYRLRALKSLARSTMDLMIHEGLSDRDLFEHSYRENAEREGQTALDNALCWRGLLDGGLFANETELAEATGVSLPNINKTLRILKLSKPVLEIISEDPASFALSTLYELALFEDVADQEDTLRLANLIRAGEVGRKEIQEARDKCSNKRERKRKETSRPYKLHREGSYDGSLKVWDSGRVMLDIMFADSKVRETVLAELKTRFGITG